MNHRNQAVRNLKELDMGQINKTQQRCLVKALAYAGLGLDVYAGEDLPSDESTTATKPKPRKVEALTPRIACLVYTAPSPRASSRSPRQYSA